MAVTMTLSISGATPEIYDRLTREMGIDPSNLPDGLVSHYASQTSDGVRIFDVWRSREAFDEYLPRLAAAVEKVTGDAAQLEPEFGELHNVLAAR
jgi:uncharacterized protein YeaC (DUF1315 family)